MFTEEIFSLRFPLTGTQRYSRAGAGGGCTARPCMLIVEAKFPGAGANLCRSSAAARPDLLHFPMGNEGAMCRCRMDMTPLDHSRKTNTMITAHTRTPKKALLWYIAQGQHCGTRTTLTGHVPCPCAVCRAKAFF